MVKHGDELLHTMNTNVSKPRESLVKRERLRLGELLLACAATEGQGWPEARPIGQGGGRTGGEADREERHSGLSPFLRRFYQGIVFSYDLKSKRSEIIRLHLSPPIRCPLVAAAMRVHWLRSSQSRKQHEERCP